MDIKYPNRIQQLMSRWLPRRLWQVYRSGDDIVAESWWTWNWTPFRFHRVTCSDAALAPNAPA